MKIKLLFNPNSLKGLERKMPVTIKSVAEVNDQKVTAYSRGLFYDREGEDVLLIQPVFGGENEIGKVHYVWTGRAFKMSTSDMKHPFKKGSKPYNQYHALLSELAKRR